MIEIKEIFFKIEAKNFEEMIWKISKKLLIKNYINESFIENIIQREKNFPTGLLFKNFAIAIPHTDPKYVKKSGIIIIKLKKPINMIHMATVDKCLKVENIFILLVNKGELQIDLLTKLINKFKNKNIQNKILNIKKKDEFFKIFQ